MLTYQKVESSKFKGYYLLCFILMLSLALNIFHNDFSIHFHADEKKKLFELSTNFFYHFRHPLFMMQLIRMFKIFLSPFYSSFSSLIVISRTVSALCGTLAVLLLFLLAKRSFKNNYFALLTALAFAVSPILVIHAHYVKESLYFTMCELFFLLRLIRYTYEQNFRNTFLLGMALGLSVSSEYIGFFSLLLFLVPLFFATNIDKKIYFKNLIVICLIACLIFVLINYPLFQNPLSFWSGLNIEISHAKNGHDTRMYGWYFYWSFHLIHSIVPGITLMVTILALLGLALMVFNWKKEPIENKILFFYTLLYYLIEETSPLKPYPDFQRYMLCIAPILIFFSMFCIYKIFFFFQQFEKRLSIVIASLLVTVSIIYPFYISVKLDYYIIKDTRILAAQWMQNHRGNFLLSSYVLGDFNLSEQAFKPIIPKIIDQAEKMHIRYFITSSFSYQRYLDALNIPNQPGRIYRIGRKYEWLFKHFHYTELKPAFRTDAFSNPIIRIIDLESPRQKKKKYH